MKKLLALVFVLISFNIVSAQILPTDSVANIASKITAGGTGTVTWAAGNYSIGTTNFTIPCGQTELAGSSPTALSYVVHSTSLNLGPTPTVHLISTSTNTAIFYTTANCSSNITIEGFDFQGVGIIGNVPAKNLIIKYNTFTHIPAHIPAASGTSNGIYIGGGNSLGQITNIDMEWNTFGDVNSCLTPQNVMDAPNGTSDQGGICDGILISGGATNVINNNNVFYHLENGGIKMVCTGPNSNTPPPYACETGALGSQVNISGVSQQFNDCIQVHRICSEIQPQPMTPAGLVTNNNTMEHMYNPQAFSMGDSFPCCNNGAANPGEITNNNVWVMDVLPGGRMAYDIEWWGNGAQTNNNLHQGYMYFGVAYGHGNSAWSASNNIFQAKSGSTFKCYVCDEGYGNAIIPTQTGNITGTIIAAITSTAPSILPASGSYSSPQTITLTDLGNTSSAGPLGNTSIYYTIDGSTPTPGCNSCSTKLYSGPFSLTITGTTVVKAIGMYGTGANTLTYPSGYGYVNSAPITATYTASGGMYISPTGSDSNSGTLVSPWLTPNHPMTCGQTIIALPGNYSNTNFSWNDWGTVTCPAANNVAWLQCQTFDACKINTTGSIYQGMWISKSFWGVQGWEVTTPATATYGTCFFISPPDSGPTEITHIILANNVANSCSYYGFFASYAGSASADYIALLGNIAYNASSANSSTDGCASGFSIYKPFPADSVTGTHIYIAGNFAWGNVDGVGCQGLSNPTDGEGVILDTLGANSYNQQVVIQNNLFFWNGGKGISVGGAGTTAAPIYIKHNTVYGNNTDLHQNNFDSGELWLSEAGLVTATGDLIAAKSATVNANLLYAMAVVNSQATNTVSGEWAYGLSGQNTVIYCSPGFSYGTNTLGTSPAFTNPINPGAPSCGSATSVPNCMSTIVADYTPTASGASAYGYQTPSTVSITDALYPQWLCTTTNIPSGLVTPGCGGSPAPTFLSGFLSNTGSINTIALGAGTIQFTANGNFSSGTTPLSLPVYSYSVSSWAVQPGSSTCGTVSSSGLFTPTTVGTCNVQAVCASCGASINVWGMTVTAATLQTVTLATTGGVTSLTIGNTNQLIATGHYSDGSTANLTSSISSCSSSNNSFATITGTGLVTAVAVGTPTFTCTANSITSSPALPITITSGVVLNTITISNPGNVNVMQLGWTLPFSAVCHYSDGTNPNCTNTVTWFSSNTSAATFTTNILKEISASAGNGYVNASMSGVTSSNFNMLYGPLGPLSFSMTGANLSFTGSSIVITYK